MISSVTLHWISEGSHARALGLAEVLHKWLVKLHHRVHNTSTQFSQAHQSRAHYVLHSEEFKPTTSCTGSPSTPRGGCRFIAAQPSVWKFGRTAGKIQWVIPVNWKYSYETIVATSGWWRQYVAVVQLSGGQVAWQARGLKVGNSMPRRPWRQMVP